MELISVDHALCARDGACMDVCPGKCLGPDAEGYPRAIAPEACIGCGHCVAVCPHGALDNLRAPLSGCVPAEKRPVDFAALAGLMKFRRSVRVFKKEPAPRETIAALLDVARFAPTACHTQQVSYVVVSDPELLRRLAASAAEIIRAAPGWERYVRLWDEGEDIILRKAPHVVIALCDAGSLRGTTDASIALTYFELAAAANGLGVCWAGLALRALAQNAGLAAAIGIPAGRAAFGVLLLGRPKYRSRLVPPRNPANVLWR